MAPGPECPSVVLFTVTFQCMSKLGAVGLLLLVLLEGVRTTPCHVTVPALSRWDRVLCGKVDTRLPRVPQRGGPLGPCAELCIFLEIPLPVLLFPFSVLLTKAACANVEPWRAQKATRRKLVRQLESLLARGVLPASFQSTWI